MNTKNNETDSPLESVSSNSNSHIGTDVEKYQYSNTHGDSIPDNYDSHFEEEEKSYGVQKVEILNKQYNHLWGKSAIFFSLFLMGFVFRLDSMVRRSMNAYATNSYKQHSLLSTVNVVRSVAAACGLPLYSRLSDIFGRIELIVVSVLLYVTGTIICTQAYDVTRYAAGMILYQFGLCGLAILFKVIAADFSNLNWRVFCTLISAAPFIINTWVSGDIVEAIGDNWSWPGIGVWAICLPVATIPLVLCFIHMQYLAKKSGDLNQLRGMQTEYKRLGFKKFVVEVFFWKLDIFGVLSLMVILGLILTPLTLAGGETAEWRTVKIIVPLILGFCWIPVFAFWENRIATHPIAPADMFRDRGVYCALGIGILIDFCWYMQGDYLYTILVVAVHESVKSATRINSLYSFSTIITGLCVGLAISKVRKMKGFIVFGVCMWLVAFGIMIRYRGGSQSHGGMIASQVLLGFGGAFFTHPVQASLQAYVNHERMATITTLYAVSYYIGSAVGSSVSGAIWTQVLPNEIGKRFTNKTLARLAYSAPLSFIKKYTWGTPLRMELVEAYRHIQKLLIIIGICFCVPILGFALFLRDPVLISAQNIVDAEDKEVKEYYGYNPLKWEFNGKTVAQYLGMKQN